MKDKLIQLAREKGFSSKLLGDIPWKYSTKEGIRYVLWMEEVKAWLRDKNVVIEVTSLELKDPCNSYVEKKDNRIIYHEKTKTDGSYKNMEVDISNSYEKKLEEALTQILRLI